MLQDNYKPKQYLGNGVTKEFYFDFDMIIADYALVDIVNIETQEVFSQKLNVDFTISLEEGVGGYVNFNNAPQEGFYVVVYRKSSTSQLSDFKTGEAFAAEKIEQAFDRLQANIQELDDEVGRAIKLGVGTEVDLTIPLPEAGKSLVWSDDGSTIVNSEVKVDELEAVLETYKNESALSAANAKTSEVMARDWAIANDGVLPDDERSSKSNANLTAAILTAPPHTPVNIMSTPIGVVSKGEKGEQGDAFVYSDFTPAQLEALKVKGDKGDKGDTGAQGEQGDAFVYSDFTTAQLEALKVKGDKGDTGAKGDKGDTGAAGAAATISVGTTTTLPSGSQATVTNVGTTSAAVFNFAIPKGADGAGGGSANWGSIGGTLSSQTDLQTALNNKVNTVVGKGLSTNDFTNAEKTKLAGLENYDDTEVRGLIAGNASAISNKEDKPETVSVTSSTPLLALANNKIYDLENLISGLTLTSVDGCGEVYFATSSAFTPVNNSSYKWDGGSPSLEANKIYTMVYTNGTLFINGGV